MSGYLHGKRVCLDINRPQGQHLFPVFDILLFFTPKWRQPLCPVMAFHQKFSRQPLSLRYSSLVFGEHIAFRCRKLVEMPKVLPVNSRNIGTVRPSMIPPTMGGQGCMIQSIMLLMGTSSGLKI